MKVLVVGGGGREHALAWKLSQSQRIQKVFVAPGNGGTARDPNLVDVPISDVKALRQWAQQEKIDLTVVGPEAPLAAGIVDEFRAHAMKIFGPTKAAAQLESSKAFSKAFMHRHGIPTALYETFTDAALAHAYIDKMGAPIVVKADGLAAGKGVVVAMTAMEAHEAIDFMLLDNSLGVVHNAGADGAAVPRVVIEEFLQGEEASFIVLCDGKNVVALATSQDHKRLLDHDEGPNTGGMGAYSPAPVMTDAVTQKALTEIVQPCMDEMAKRGTPFEGVLFVGLMIEDGQPKLIEYNVRFGDPECQTLMMRLGGQILDLLQACAEHRLADAQVNWADDHAITIVMAANGYPAAYEKGTVIKGLDALPEDSKNMVFHAGTASKDGQIVATGGRVLAVTARGENLKEARDRAYAMTQQIDWPEGFYRSDIGWRAL